MQRVSIVGLGLIGSSIGLGLRRWATRDGKRDSVLELSGFDTSLEVQNYAKKLKAVDRTEWNLPSAVASADFLIIATPVLAEREVFEVIAQHGKEGLVVTDTASTKAEVMGWARDLLPAHVSFVGGHPLAGKTLGVEGATADLFKGATWCVAPAVSASEEAVQTVLGMVTALEAEPLFVDAHEHDGFVGGISHLPFMLATALVRSVGKDAGWRDMRKLTAGGFRDVSRLASGSPEMYRDISATNRDNMVRWADAAIAELIQMRELLVADDIEGLESVYRQARDIRAEWLTGATGDGSDMAKVMDEELPEMNVGEQMQQMLFGGLFRRKPRVGAGPGAERGDKTRSGPTRR